MESKMDCSNSFTKLDLEKIVFFLCDMQEKFRPAIKYFSDIVEVAQRLVLGCEILDIPLIVTEQYPKGLGSTVPELDIQHAAGRFEKTKFSMLIPEVEEKLLEVNENLKYAVLFGIEAHVCIQQTAFDLLERGFEVCVIVDATSSRSQMDRKFAFERLRQMGVILTTSESLLLQIIADKSHPKFRDIQSLIKKSAPDSGLCSL